MTEIKPEHWAHFVQLCKDISELVGIELDAQAMRDTYIANFGSNFPEKQSGISMRITYVDPLGAGNATGIHLLLVVCGTPQHRDEIADPSLGIKVVNMQADRVLFEYDVFEDGRLLLESAALRLDYDVFEDGRLLLESTALRLDTIDEGCKYDPDGTFPRDHEMMFASRQDLSSFCLGCIAQFPTTGPKGEAIKLKLNIKTVDVMSTTERNTAEA